TPLRRCLQGDGHSKVRRRIQRAVCKEGSAVRVRCAIDDSVRLGGIYRSHGRRALFRRDCGDDALQRTEVAYAGWRYGTACAAQCNGVTEHGCVLQRTAHRGCCRTLAGGGTTRCPPAEYAL